MTVSLRVAQPLGAALDGSGAQECDITVNRVRVCAIQSLRKMLHADSSAARCWRQAALVDCSPAARIAAGTGRRLESHWYTLQGIGVSEHRMVSGLHTAAHEHTAAH